MKRFDTKVQHLKYQVLREVARYAWDDSLLEHITDIPKSIIPGKTSTMRCCVYKERAILAERVKIAMGGNSSSDGIIEVIDIACDECAAGGYTVTESCRGCLAHRCENVCPKGAISFDSRQKASIDKSKCVNCGKCAQVCPYSAIINYKRPCENACKIKAISMAEDGSAQIDQKKCISCGACVYQCPFGAISDKSYILDVINMLKSGGKVCAVVAPSISSQFSHAALGQVMTGIKRLGFSSVIEAALGADLVADEESRELERRGFLTSSCCPALVDYIRKQVPELTADISQSLSPMATIAQYIKSKDPDTAVVFIGPCTAKKAEIRQEKVYPWVDSAITFEELQALFDSRDIDITALEETELNRASYFGRIFAHCGGLADAIAEGLKEHGSDFELRAVSCNGIEECRTALFKAAKGKRDFNFIEGMACVGGCVEGAGCLTHNENSRTKVHQYGKAAAKKTIAGSISELK